MSNRYKDWMVLKSIIEILSNQYNKKQIMTFQMLIIGNIVNCLNIFLIPLSLGIFQFFV
jgi:hypothetical protein